MAPAERSTHRLVAWLLAVAGVAVILAVLLLALPGPAPVVPPAVPLRSAGAELAAAVQGDSHGATANDREPATDASPAPRATDPLAARSLWVRIRARFASGTQYYLGPLQVDGEPPGPRQVTLDSSAPLPVQFDGGTPLVFRAPGYAPNVCTPPADADGDRPIDIELQPESSLRFRWLPAPVALDHLQLLLQVPAPSAYAGHAVGLPLPAETTVALAGGKPVRWSVTARAGSRVLRASGSVDDLGLAEQRCVLVDLGLDAGRRHRLIGPSAELLPHLAVWWHASDRPGMEALVVDRGGCFTRPQSDSEPVMVHAIDHPIATVATAHDDEVLLTLAEPVVGVRLVLDSGAGQLSEVLGPDGGVLSRGAAETHVFPRSQLPAQLQLKVNGQVATFATSTLAANADLLVLRLADALPALRLSVEFTGPAPIAAVRKALRLVVAGDGGATVKEHAHAERCTFDLPSAGEWTLRWQCAGILGPVVGRAMVALGAPAELRVEWPLVHEWTGEIAGFTELPLPQRWHRVGFGAGESILAGWVLRPDPKGQFRGFRFAADVPSAPAFLAWGMRRVEAVIEARDDERRHLVVRPSAALRWVEVQIQGAPDDCTAQIFVVPTGGAPRMVHVLSKQQAWPVPVVGDETIVVALCAGQSSLTPVLAWLSLPAGATSVAIAPMALRRLELRDASAGSGARTFSPVGPHGVSAGQIELPAGGRIVVEVPFDTRGLQEWSEDAVDVPVGAGEIVVLP